MNTENQQSNGEVLPTESGIIIGKITKVPSPSFWELTRKAIFRWAFTLLVLISPLVIVHELAHMLTGRMFGMEVETFNLGFGHSLADIQLGEITYHFRIILFGGYVKFAESMKEFPLWQQVIVLLAGCMSNIILFLLLARLFIRRRKIWCKSAISFMGSMIWNIVMKTFFLPWRVEGKVSLDRLFYRKWTNYSKYITSLILGLAFFSINLGMFNLIPLAGVLDGGKISSLLLTPLLGVEKLNLVSSVLFSYVLHRWITFEYGVKNVYLGFKQLRKEQALRNELFEYLRQDGSFTAEKIEEVKQFIRNNENSLAIQSLVSHGFTSDELRVKAITSLVKMKGKHNERIIKVPGNPRDFFHYVLKKNSSSCDKEFPYI